MSASQVCPEAARLRALLEGDLPANQQVELTCHLDTCSNCQKTLESLAGGSTNWPGTASEIIDEQPDADAALQQLMHNLKQKASEAATQVGSSTGQGSGIEFLGPPQKPGHLGSRHRVQKVVGGGVAASLAVPALARQEISQLVADHRKQPGAERTALRVVVEPAHGPCDGAQDILGQVCRIGILQAMLASEAIDQRGVDIHKFGPGLGVTRIPNAHQQARPG